MEKKKKKASAALSMIPQIVAGMLLGAFCGFYGAKTGYEIMGGDKNIAGLLLGVLLVLVQSYLAMYLQTVIHEGGHLACGLLSGYGFVSFRVGSRMLIKEGKKFKIKKYSLPGTGGQCLLSPPKWQDGNFPYVFYNFGGCLFNLFFSGIFAAFYFLFKGNPYVSGFFVMGAVIGIYLAVMNGIPFRIGGIENDGFNVRSMKRDIQARKSFGLITDANAQSARGVRIKDMPPKWFGMPADEKMDNSLTASVGVLMCNRAMDEKELEKAWDIGNHLLETADGLALIHRHLVTLDMLFCALVLGRDAEKFLREYEDKKFARILKSISTFPSVLRTCYTYELLCKQDTEAVGKKKEEFEKLTKTYPYPCETEGEKELMLLADDKARQRRFSLTV